MAKFIKGYVVVVPFPFSDLTQSKRRPALGNIRPNRIFTADSNIVPYKVGNIKTDKLNEIIEKIVEIVRG